MGMNYYYSVYLNSCKRKSGGRDYYRNPQMGERYTGRELGNNAQTNLDDRHVSSFVPPLGCKRAGHRLNGAAEIRAGPIPSRPGKNVATAYPSMEFHRRIPGRQFASCIRISRIPSPCIGSPALIAVVDRRKNVRIDARTTPRDHRSVSLLGMTFRIVMMRISYALNFPDE